MPGLLTALGPVVTGTTLTEDKVVGTEEAAERAGADGIHGSGLEVNEYGTRHILVAARLVVVDRDTLELEVVLATVCAVVLEAMLLRDDFPEFGTDLVTALDVVKASEGMLYMTKWQKLLTWPVWTWTISRMLGRKKERGRGVLGSDAIGDAIWDDARA
jgi:hypothetical protein